MNGLLAALPFVGGERANTATGRGKQMEPVAPSSVSKYIYNLPVASGVDKYLLRQSQNQPPTKSGVAKYLADKPQQTRIIHSSGVGKYLNKQTSPSKKPSPISSVARYLVKVPGATVSSGVDKYLAKLVAANIVSSNLSGVDKYKHRHEIAHRKEAANMLVEKYLAQQIEDDKQLALAQEEASKTTDIEQRIAQAMDALEDTNQATSGVAKYAKQQAKLAKDKPKISGVGKYLAHKKATNSTKPATSSVTKYLQQQMQDQYRAPKVSKVAKYITRKTSNDKYKPQMSNVAKYVANIRYMTKTALDIIDRALEGEFIPANRTTKPANDHHLSGVANYLQSQPKHAISGVAKYLKNRPEPMPATIATGVQKYMQAHATPVVEPQTESAPEPVQVSGVSKYITQESAKRASGVAKYILSKQVATV